MRTRKGLGGVVVSFFLFCLLLATGAAYAACPGGGFHTSTTDITQGAETDNPSFLQMSISGTSPVSPSACFGTVEPSWSFNLEIRNISDHTARGTQIKFDNLVIKYYDSGGTFLGSTTLNQADWITYFDSGNFAGGTFSVPYILEPGEYCAGCFCAHLAGKASGYLKLVGNYTLPDSASGFPHSIEIPIPPDIIKAMRDGRPLVVPLRADGTLAYQELSPSSQKYHPRTGTVVSVQSPTQVSSDSVALNADEFNRYTIDGMPANGSNLSGTVNITGGYFTLELLESGTAICTDAGTSNLSCSKASPDATKSYIFKLTSGAADSTSEITITWDIPSIACNGNSNVVMLAEKDYYFSTNPGASIDVLHLRGVNVTSGAAIDLGIYAAYPYNHTAACTGSGSGGDSASCSKADAANQTWYSRISAGSGSSADLYVECHTTASATSLTAGTAVTANIPEQGWKYYKLAVPSGQELVAASMQPQAGTEDDDLYIKSGGLPLPGDNDGYRSSGGAGVVEQVMALNPAAGTWYLGGFCQNYVGDGADIVMNYFDQDTTTSLTNGTAQSVTVKKNQWVFRKFVVPGTANGVTFTVDNVPVGKSVKLYTMQGHFPTIDPSKNYCNTTASSDSAGECKHPPSTFDTGTWYVGIFGSGLDTSSSISVDVKAEYTEPPESIGNGDSKNFSVNAGEWKYYAASPGGTYDYMKGRVHGVVGNNPDLYVRKGDTPTTATYDQKSTNGAGEYEGLLIGQTDNSTYNFGIYGVGTTGANTGTLTVSWGNGTSLPSGNELSVSLDGQDFAVYKMNVSLSATALGVSQTTSTGDLDLYTYAGVIDGTPDCSSTTSGPGTESCDHSSPAHGTWFAVVKGVNNAVTSSGDLIAVQYGTTGKLTGKLNLAP